MRRFQGEITQSDISREEESMYRDVREVAAAFKKGEVSDQLRQKAQDLFEDLRQGIDFHLSRIERALKIKGSFSHQFWRLDKIFTSLYLMSFLGLDDYPLKKREIRYLLKKDFPQKMQEVAKMYRIQESEKFKKDTEFYSERVDALTDFLEEVLKMQ